MAWHGRFLFKGEPGQSEASVTCLISTYYNDRNQAGSLVGFGGCGQWPAAAGKVI